MLGNLHYCPFWRMGNLFNTHQHLDLVCIFLISWWNISKIIIDFTSILYMHIVKLEFPLYFNFFGKKLLTYASDDPILTGKKDKMNSLRTLWWYHPSLLQSQRKWHLLALHLLLMTWVAIKWVNTSFI